MQIPNIWNLPLKKWRSDAGFLAPSKNAPFFVVKLPANDKFQDSGFLQIDRFEFHIHGIEQNFFCDKMAQ